MHMALTVAATSASHLAKQELKQPDRPSRDRFGQRETVGTTLTLSRAAEFRTELKQSEKSDKSTAPPPPQITSIRPVVLF